MFCQNCGAQLTPGANFCGRCGARVTQPDDAASTANASTPATSPFTSTTADTGVAASAGDMGASAGAAGMAPAAPSAPASAPTGLEGIEKEPMLLLDVTGSMNFGTSENDQTPRRDTIREAISTIVSTLAAQDSQAEHEEEGGGLRTVIFAGGQARDIGDLNPDNLAEVWSRITWAGGTRIMPGWNTLIDTYMDEFGGEDPASRPLLMALVITDGEADDTDQFAQAIAQASGGVYVVLAIIGYGPDHDAALRAYQAIEQNNAHVRVLPFASETDPQVIARALLRMIA